MQSTSLNLGLNHSMHIVIKERHNIENNLSQHYPSNNDKLYILFA